MKAPNDFIWDPQIEVSLNQPKHFHFGSPPPMSNQGSWNLPEIWCWIAVIWGTFTTQNLLAYAPPPHLSWTVSYHNTPHSFCWHDTPLAEQFLIIFSFQLLIKSPAQQFQVSAFARHLARHQQHDGTPSRRSCRWPALAAEPLIWPGGSSQSWCVIINQGWPWWFMMLEIY